MCVRERERRREREKKREIDRETEKYTGFLACSSTLTSATSGRSFACLTQHFRIIENTFSGQPSGLSKVLPCTQNEMLFSCCGDHKRATKYRSLLRKITYKDKASYDFLVAEMTVLQGGEDS